MFCGINYVYLSTLFAKSNQPSSWTSLAFQVKRVTICLKFYRNLMANNSGHFAYIPPFQPAHLKKGKSKI